MADPPPPGRADWILTAVLVIGALIEVAIRDFPWELAHLVATVGAALALPWRRVHPFALAVGAFGAMATIEIASAIAGTFSDGIYTGAFLLMIPYAILRWGSGRHALLALPVMVVFPWFVLIDGNGAWGEAIGGSIFLLFPAAIGASVRFRKVSREQQMDRVRMQEREQLARELHDTVAHHVSAIAIQAQAGRAVASSDPEAAIRTLDVIEEAASRTLSDMRAMVGILRDTEAADLAPQPQVNDVARLADISGHGPSVDVRLSGDLDGLRPAVSTAVYRMAQESITNARRHARGGSKVIVDVLGDPESVRLTVTDDGARSTGVNADGYGLAGMAERAKLLGGTFSAGPGIERGWVVEAILPKNGDTS